MPTTLTTQTVPHPQTLLMSLIGLHLLDDDRPVSGTSVVQVLGRLGVAESAARSVLQRVTARGLIERHKEGRRTFYSPTPLGREVLTDGRAKMFHHWRTAAWDGRWTFIGVTVPEQQRAVRHRVHNRLSWAGFARLPGSMWAAPGEHDVTDILGDIPDAAPVVLLGLPRPPTTDAQLVAAYRLADVADGFRGFLSRWTAADDGTGSVDDALTALVRRLRLHTEWLALTRDDPQLPEPLLPSDWPGRPAGDLFRRLDRDLADREQPVIDHFFAGTLAQLPRRD